MRKMFFESTWLFAPRFMIFCSGQIIVFHILKTEVFWQKIHVADTEPHTHSGILNIPVAISTHICCTCLLICPTTASRRPADAGVRRACAKTDKEYLLCTSALDARAGRLCEDVYYVSRNTWRWVSILSRLFECCTSGVTCALRRMYIFRGSFKILKIFLPTTINVKACLKIVSALLAAVSTYFWRVIYFLKHFSSVRSKQSMNIS